MHRRCRTAKSRASCDNAFPAAANQSLPLKVTSTGRSVMRREFQQQGMLFAKIAHKKLLDLQAPGVPPRHAHKESDRCRCPGKAGRFGVQKQPLAGSMAARGTRREFGIAAIKTASDRALACRIPASVPCRKARCSP